MERQTQFEALVAVLRAALHPAEQFSLAYEAEASDFIRFNHGQVRQAGCVQQASVSLKLIHEGRHADLTLTLADDSDEDRRRLEQAVTQVRQALPLLPPDPYLLPNTEAWHSENRQAAPLPDTQDVVARISERAHGLDLVGIYAAGPIYRGFASSWGQWAGTRPIASTSTGACFTPMARR